VNVELITVIRIGIVVDAHVVALRSQRPAQMAGFSNQAVLKIRRPGIGSLQIAISVVVGVVLVRPAVSASQWPAGGGKLAWLDWSLHRGDAKPAVNSLPILSP
jgi:hypothetical protein